MKRLLTLGLAAGLAVAAPVSAFGCAACFGKSDSAMAYGMNAGIMALLAVILPLLALIASFFVFVARRAGRAGAESDSHPPSV